MTSLSAADAAFKILTLERLRHVRQEAIGRRMPQVMSDAEFVTWIDHMTDRMIVRFQSEVLADRLADDVIEVTFEYPANWWQHWKAACLHGALARRFPPKMGRHTSRVNVASFVSFPENSMIYPKQLGSTVRVQTAGPPTMNRIEP